MASGKSGKSRRKRLINELDWLDPEQRLTHDEFPDLDKHQSTPTLRQTISRGARSTLAVILCVVVPVLWYFDWSPAKAVQQGGEAITAMTGGGEIQAPPAPAEPDIVEPKFEVSGAVNYSITEYMARLNELGYLDRFSSSAASALYRSGVPISFLQELDEAGLLDNWSYSGIIALSRTEVPVAYLREVQQAGFIDDFSYSGLIALNRSGVPVGYLTEMREAGLMADFSYSGLIALNRSEVPVGYLSEMKQAGFMDAYSYSGLIALNRSGVPVNFLQELKGKELLNNMSYTDVIVMYRSDNGR